MEGGLCVSPLLSFVQNGVDVRYCEQSGEMVGWEDSGHGFPVHFHRFPALCAPFG